VEPSSPSNAGKVPNATSGRDPLAETTAIPPRRSSSASASSAELSFGQQLEVLSQRALSGTPEDIQRLTSWSSLLEKEAQVLRRRLRKQQHDFVTLFEIVGQTSARSLDLMAMQTYLLRTVSGHFAAPRVLILRRLRPEDNALSCAAAQGVREPECVLPADSPLCELALTRHFCFRLKELADNPPEVAALRKLGLDLVVPLIQEVEGPSGVLEGLLLLGPRLSSQSYGDEDLELLHVLGKMLAICLRNEALYRRSIVDDLTGVASRGHFDAQLNQELQRIVTYGHRSLGLIMLDVDHFKNFNDRFGHQTGDRVLKELARLLVKQVRTVDMVARYGGEEFAIILLEIERPKVMEVAQRLCKAVEDMEVLSLDGQPLSITASFGVACFPDDALDKSTLIQMADRALYRSKDAGRNQVTAIEPGAGLKNGKPAPRTAAVPLLQPTMQPRRRGEPPDNASDLTKPLRIGLVSATPVELASLDAERRKLTGDDGLPSKD
jgi:diguanylate cyclase (GGDEF)-like protein